MSDKISRIKLSTPREVRESLAKVTRLMLRGEIDTKTCNTFGYMCNQILGSIRADEQERLLKELALKVEELENENK